MTNKLESKKDTRFKTGDIIEVSMRIEYQIPIEDEVKSDIDVNDYEAKYSIYYSFPRKLGFSAIDFSVEAGYCPSFCDDIEQYIEESIEQDLEEIAEYELFDVNNTGEYQTAKIRVKALK